VTADTARTRVMQRKRLKNSKLRQQPRDETWYARLHIRLPRGGHQNLDEFAAAFACFPCLQLTRHGAKVRQWKRESQKFRGCQVTRTGVGVRPGCGLISCGVVTCKDNEKWVEKKETTNQSSLKQFSLLKKKKTSLPKKKIVIAIQLFFFSKSTHTLAVEEERR
jgi:hypothetical protein